MKTTNSTASTHRAASTSAAARGTARRGGVGRAGLGTLALAGAVEIASLGGVTQANAATGNPGTAGEQTGSVQHHSAQQVGSQGGAWQWPSDNAPGAPRKVPESLGGRVVDVTFDNGAASTLGFSPDATEVSYRDLESGAVTTVPVRVVKNADGIFLVTWYEPDTKYTVTHLQNYNTGKLSSTWTYPDAQGTMVIEGHQGTVELKN